jgi:acyl carrier protein
MNEDAVIAAIADELEVAPEAVRLEGDFQKDYGIDSLDLVRLVMAVEVAAGLRIDDKAAAKVRTVGDLLDLVHMSESGRTG